MSSSFSSGNLERFWTGKIGSICVLGAWHTQCSKQQVGSFPKSKILVMHIEFHIDLNIGKEYIGDANYKVSY